MGSDWEGKKKKKKSLNVNTDSSGRCVGGLMRIQVLMDIYKLLRRRARIQLAGGGAIVNVDLKYE